MPRILENAFEETFAIGGTERMRSRVSTRGRIDASRDRASGREAIRNARREKGEARSAFTDWDCRSQDARA